jgi:hypothetical protein
MKDPGLDMSMILKWILKKYVKVCGLDFVWLRKELIKHGISSPAEPLFHPEEVFSCPALA